MSKVLAVAWREFKYTALTKAFIIGTIIFPLVIWAGMAVVPLLFKPTPTVIEGTLAIVDPTGDVVTAAMTILNAENTAPDPLAESIKAAQSGAIDAQAMIALANDDVPGNPFSSRVQFNLNIESHADTAQLDSLHARIRSGDLLGAVVLEPNVIDEMAKDGVTLYVATQANPDHVEAIRRAIGKAIVIARTTRAGLDIDAIEAMTKTPILTTRRLTEAGEAAAGIELQKLLPIAFMFLLWVSAFASGNYLLTSTIEEKSNKVMEVLLSAVSPLQLMTGKILGQAVVGIMTIAVYGMLGIAALSFFAMADLIQIQQIIYLALYYFMAYFMVAAMMAAVGSAVSDLQEAHAIITPAMMVLFLPMILFVPVSQSPNGMLAVITSFIPLLTPFVMIIRVTAAEPVPLWQIVLSMVVGFGGVAAMIWMAGRIFRIGVLMYGKPPSLLELLKWMRYS